MARRPFYLDPIPCGYCGRSHGMDERRKLVAAPEPLPDRIVLNKRRERDIRQQADPKRNPSAGFVGAWLRALLAECDETRGWLRRERKARIELGDALSSALDELEAAREALGACAVVIEPLAGQIGQRPYKELSPGMQEQISRAQLALRQWLSSIPKPQP